MNVDVSPKALSASLNPLDLILSILECTIDNHVYRIVEFKNYTAKTRYECMKYYVLHKCRNKKLMHLFAASSNIKSIEKICGSTQKNVNENGTLILSS